MGKSKYKESKKIVVEGVLNLSDLAVEIEDIGSRALEDILEDFDGEGITLTISSESEF